MAWLTAGVLQEFAPCAGTRKELARDESSRLTPVSVLLTAGDGNARSYTFLSLFRYFLIERGKNMCGLAACASYPVPQV